MDVIDAILERAFWEPPRFSSLDKYLRHQYVLQDPNFEIDEEGNPPECVTMADFPPNQSPPHTFNLVPGTVIGQKLKQPRHVKFYKFRVKNFWTQRCSTINIFQLIVLTPKAQCRNCQNCQNLPISVSSLVILNLSIVR